MEIEDMQKMSNSCKIEVHGEEKQKSTMELIFETIIHPGIKNTKCLLNNTLVKGELQQ